MLHVMEMDGRLEWNYEEALQRPLNSKALWRIMEYRVGFQPWTFRESQGLVDIMFLEHMRSSNVMSSNGWWLVE